MSVITLLLWPLLAFGGEAANTAIPFGIVSVAYAIVSFARVRGGLDRALLLMLVAVLVQLIPLPPDLATLISPHRRSVREALALTPLNERWHPITVDPASTGWAAIELAGAIALFLAAREGFRVSGVRRTSRAIAAFGFGVSLLAVIQASTAGRSIYWLFPTQPGEPLPLGPFVNRNHFATWAIMALPLCTGYIAARVDARHRPADRLNSRARVLDLNDDRTLWLTVSVAALTVALLLSLSRPAAFGLGLSSLTTLFLIRRMLHPRRLRSLAVSVVLLLTFALGWAALGTVRERIAGLDAPLADRMSIWRETGPMVRDFMVSGTGAGTYELGMRVYQRSDRRVYFNQAQNHYLQLAAEGGLLLDLPFLLAAIAFVQVARQRLTTGKSGLWWVRVGAACGLGAVAIQSIWETGLTMTANAALAAVLAAIVVHRRE